MHTHEQDDYQLRFAHNILVWQNAFNLIESQAFPEVCLENRIQMNLSKKSTCQIYQLKPHVSRWYVLTRSPMKILSIHQF